MLERPLPQVNAWMGSEEPLRAGDRQASREGQQDGLRVELQPDDQSEDRELSRDRGEGDDPHKAVGQQDQCGKGAKAISIGLGQLDGHKRILAFRLRLANRMRS